MIIAQSTERATGYTITLIELFGGYTVKYGWDETQHDTLASALRAFSNAVDHGMRAEGHLVLGDAAE